MYSVFSDMPAERVIGRIQAYYSTIDLSCEICGWVQPQIYDPSIMDYQCFATWPMMYPGEHVIRDVTLCMGCFHLASNASPNINNPEDIVYDNFGGEDDNVFEGFDFEQGIDEEIREYAPEYVPELQFSDVMAAIVSAMAIAENPVPLEFGSLDPVG